MEKLVSDCQNLFNKFVEAHPATHRKKQHARLVAWIKSSSFVAGGVPEMTATGAHGEAFMPNDATPKAGQSPRANLALKQMDQDSQVYLEDSERNFATLEESSMPLPLPDRLYRNAGARHQCAATLRDLDFEIRTCRHTFQADHMTVADERRHGDCSKGQNGLRFSRSLHSTIGS